MSNAALYAAVRDAAAGTFDILGELGASAVGGSVYLAREIDGESLVVLTLEPAPPGPDGPQYYLDVLRELDASVPDVELRCPRCRGNLRQWARFCTQCGLDVSGEAPASGELESRAALREKVRAATAGQYEFLGDFPRAEGGGLVYFARDLSDGKIVTLRLQRDMNQRLGVGVTRTLKAFDAERGRPVPKGQPAVTIVQRTPLRAGNAPGGGARKGGGVVPVGSPRGAAMNGRSPSRGPVADESLARGSDARSRGGWKFGRAEIVAAIAVALILILLLLRL